MRHKKRRRRLNRNASERKALMKSLVSALLTRQRITTTLAKAKEARRLAENVITLGKRGDLSSQRNLFSILLDRSLIKEIVSEIAPRFKTRQGGYTRIIRTANRRKGDNAEMVLLELTEQKVVTPTTKKAKKEKKEAPAAEKPQKPLKAEKTLKEELPKEAPAQKPEPPKPIKKEKYSPKKEKYPPKEEKRPPAEKSKKGFFQGLKRFLKPKGG
ncbi:MAG: 50S ribosomal protein L17 [Candidatus Omnitrophica bacterium]|nr:50S ribosomal protein L17 [Candidatus Omnitrophota bacterium]